MSVTSADPLPTPSVIVLDFDGEVLSYVPDAHSDAEAGITGLGECAGTWPAFGDPEREAALLERVQALFAGFDVRVTDEPLCDAPYLRIVVGPFQGCGVGVGYADSACDRPLGRGVAFAKIAADDGRTLDEQAVIIAHEAGHAFGLAHVDASGDIMNPSVGNGDKVFVDACLPYDSTGAGGDACGIVGRCPVLSPEERQNSWLGLMSILGPAPETRPNDVCAAEDDPDAESGCGCRSQPGHGPVALIAWFFVGLACPTRRARRIEVTLPIPVVSNTFR